jgi:hypothetical protein
MNRQSNAPLFDKQKYAYPRKATNYDADRCEFSPVSYFFSLFGPNIVLKSPQLRSSLGTTDQVPQPN